MDRTAPVVAVTFKNSLRLISLSIMMASLLWISRYSLDSKFKLYHYINFHLRLLQEIINRKEGFFWRRFHGGTMGFAREVQFPNCFPKKRDQLEEGNN
jgi:hypothetical protein